ncbi:MAG: hypothetical protein Q8R86_08435 [Sulfuricurvum sp.]|nr:hypothetical protein [Sulfuricurvum sp.]
MRILLLNDNPVVRKLVALSAQKTKDDLNVVWSADEIEHDKYDLLIVDDAHYSDEVMAVLKEKIVFERSLLMATRGNAIPAGFDHVINKPFLPTDLVELFAGIENSLSKAALKEEESAVDTQSVDLESMLEGLEDEESFDTLDLDEMFDFDEPIELSDEVPDTFKTNVLDHEEVQELQDLLDDTDEQESGDEFILDDLEFEEQAINEIVDLADEESDDDLLDGMDHFELEDDEKGVDDLDDLIPEEDITESEAAVLSDEEFGDLELQIQEAVGELGLEDLEQELEDEQLEDLDIGDLDMLEETDMFDGMDMFGDLDELDSIDEREMKLAVGEAVEPEIQAEEEPFSMDVRDEAVFESKPLTTAMEEKNLQHEGMEALNTLLKVLSSDDVVKSLKGLNISININFGNEK